MKYTVDGWNNFCRVFELPDKFSSGFCFGGGIPTNFQMVDWFNPVPNETMAEDGFGLPQPACSKKDWLEKYGEIKTVEVDEEWVREKLLIWLKKKVYVKTGKQYIIIFDFGLATLFAN